MSRSEPTLACPHCGGACTQDARFCVECGRGLDGSSSAPLSSIPAPSPGSKATLIGQAALTATHGPDVSVDASSTPSSDAAHPASPFAGTLAEPAPPFSAMLGALDGGFDAILQPLGAPASEPAQHHPADAEEVAKLFREVAATHLQPVHHFMIEAELGEPSKEWLDLVTPAVAGLTKAAAQLDLGPLASALTSFQAALESADAAPGARIGGAQRQALLASYGALAMQLPVAFAVSEEATRREPVILRALLRQVPGVHKVTLDRLFHAGLTRLSQYLQASPQELAEASGVQLALAGAILERLQRHQQEIGGMPPDRDRQAEYGLLAELTRTLEQQHSVYEQGSVNRRQARQERADTLLAITVVLGRLGLVPLVDTLERLPFGRKIELLYAEVERHHRTTLPPSP